MLAAVSDTLARTPAPSAAYVDIDRHTSTSTEIAVGETASSAHAAAAAPAAVAAGLCRPCRSSDAVAVHAVEAEGTLIRGDASLESTACVAVALCAPRATPTPCAAAAPAAVSVGPCRPCRSSDAVAVHVAEAEGTLIRGDASLESTTCTAVALCAPCATPTPCASAAPAAVAAGDTSDRSGIAPARATTVVLTVLGSTSDRAVILDRQPESSSYG